MSPLYAGQQLCTVKKKSLGIISVLVMITLAGFIKNISINVYCTMYIRGSRFSQIKNQLISKVAFEKSRVFCYSESFSLRFSFKMYTKYSSNVIIFLTSNNIKLFDFHAVF